MGKQSTLLFVEEIWSAWEVQNEGLNFNTNEVENPPVLAHSLYIILFTSDPYCLYKDGHINIVAIVYSITDINLERILQDF